MNPIIKKDLQKTARQLRFFLFIAAFLCVASAPLIVVVATMGSDSSAGKVLFAITSVIQGLCIWIAIPAYAGSAIASERQRRTFDLLRITMLQPWHIVWGKFVAIMCYIAVFLTAFLPLIMVSFLFGGIGPGAIAANYLFLLAGAATATMFCLMLSAASSKPVTTIIVGYAVMLLTLISVGPMGALVSFAIGMRMGMIPMQGPGFPSLGIGILATSFFLALAWSFFYLAATSLLKPPSWNRSTSLRIWFVAFMLTSLGFFSYALTAVMPTVTDRAIIVYLAGFVGIPSVFAAIGFCGEPWELSSRMKDKLKKIPYLLRISFGPGSIAGGVFVRAMCLLTGAAALRTPAKMQEMVLWIFLGIFVYVNFCCSLAATVRALWDTPKSRLITVLILAGLCLFPCVGFLEHSSRSWFANIIYLNPFAALAESRGTGFADLHYGGIIFFGFHIVCAAVLFAVRRVYMMAQRPAAVIAQGPDRPAAASPGPAGAPPL